MRANSTEWSEAWDIISHALPYTVGWVMMTASSQRVLPLTGIGNDTESHHHWWNIREHQDFLNWEVDVDVWVWFLLPSNSGGLLRVMQGYMHKCIWITCTKITSNYVIKLPEFLIILGAVVELEWEVPPPQIHVSFHGMQNYTFAYHIGRVCYVIGCICIWKVLVV